DPAQGSIPLQMLLLGLLFILASLLVFSAIAWGAGVLGQKLRRSSRWQQIMNRTASLIFIALAIRLATTER
ncbi:MAG: LysE family transporter, partial [Cohaesibacter sp.]|nr:LysE family transporter [Cohaesibacter sp.]